MSSDASVPVPVTVLTGFLGSGKTTLLNRILTAQHGRKLAVIENEFGEVGVDHQLVIQSDEELFEMNNGCICCKVRGDLIRILGRLMKRKDKLDGILIETTGLADPGPVAQTFFTDDEMKAAFRLDAIVTVVDAKHIATHLDQDDESRVQIGFADVILLNKTDLVAPAELDALESRIHGINAAARIHRTQNCDIDLAKVLDVGGFNLSRATELDPRFMEPEYPFEWAGAYELAPGPYELAIGHAPDDECDHEHGECDCDHHHGDGEGHEHKHSHAHTHDHEADASGNPAHGEEGHVCGSGCGHSHDELDVLIMPLKSRSEADLRSATDAALLVFSDWEKNVLPGEPITIGGTLHRLKLHDGYATFPVTIEHPGDYLLITGHDVPTHLHGPDGEVVRYGWDRTFRHEHRHNDDVTSVGIHSEGVLDPKRLNNWIGELLRTKGGDIYRMKGVLNVHGADRRLVFQGVHMLFDARLDRPWAKGEDRKSTLVFIGKNLERGQLTESFQSCLR